MRRLAVLAAPAGASAVLAAGAQAADQTVGFGSDRLYRPAEVTIAAGESVTFAPDFGNTFDPQPARTHHPLDFVDPSIPDQVGGADAVVRTFPQPGTFAFFCRIHGTATGEGMAGRVIVQAPGGDAGTGTAGSPPTSDPALAAPSPAATGPATPAPDLQAPVVRLRGFRAAGLARRAALVRFGASEPGRAEASLSAFGRRLGHGATSFDAAGRHVVKIRLGRAALGVLRRRGPLQATLRLTVRDRAGNARVLRRAVVLRV